MSLLHHVANMTEYWQYYLWSCLLLCIQKRDMQSYNIDYSAPTLLVENMGQKLLKTMHCSILLKFCRPVQ